MYIDAAKHAKDLARASGEDIGDAEAVDAAADEEHQPAPKRARGVFSLPVVWGESHLRHVRLICSYLHNNSGAGSGRRAQRYCRFAIGSLKAHRSQCYYSVLINLCLSGVLTIFTCIFR